MRAIAWNTGVQIAGKVLSTAFGVIIVGLMTRYLGQDGFGIYSTANAYLSVFALLIDLGLNVTIVSILGEHLNDRAYETRAVSAIFTLRLVSSFVAYGLALPIMWLFPYSHVTQLAIIALLASFFVTSLNQIVTGVQQRHLKTHVTAVAENIGRLILLVGLLIARFLGLGLVPVVWIVSLGSLLNFFLNFFVARRYANFRWNWDPAFWKIVLKRSWPIGLSIAFNLIYYKADTLILASVRSSAEVGIYSAAYRVLDILVTIPFMYAGVVLPILSNHWAKKHLKDFQKLLGQSVGVMSLLIAPLIGGTMILGTRVMMLVAGVAFAQAGDILRILLLAAGSIYINTIFSYAVVAVDRQRKMIPWYIAVALVTLAGYLIFIPRYGMWGAAWLTVFSETAICFASIGVTRSAALLTPAWRTIGASVGASLIMMIAVWLSRMYWLPIPILVGAIVYVALVYGLGGVSKNTIRELTPSLFSNRPSK